MKVVFHTLTGQTKRFIQKLDLPSEAIVELSPVGQSPLLSEPFILILPTYNDSIDFVEDFLVENQTFCRGIIGIGNRNFGTDFCREARELSQEYHLPLLYELEFNGTEADINTVKGILRNES